MTAGELADKLAEDLREHGHLSDDEPDERWWALLRLLEQETAAVLRHTYLAGDIAGTLRLLNNINVGALS